MSTSVFRSFLKAFIFFIVLGSGIILIGADHVTAQGYRHPQTDITLPDSIGGSLYLWKVTNFEKDHPGVGVGVSYRHAQQLMRVDIYFYTNKEPNIPHGITSVVEKELKNIIQGLKYQNLSIVIPKEIIPIGSMPFLHSALTYSQNDKGWVSHRYLTGYRNHFIKIYITYTADNATEGERLTSAVLHTVGNALPQ